MPRPCLLCLLLLVAAIPAAADGFRVSGILVTSSGKYIATIEDANGEQMLYRTGDRLGDGVIEAMGPGAVTVRLGAAVVELGLRAAAHPLTLAVTGRAPPVPDQIDTMPEPTRSEALRFAWLDNRLTALRRDQRRRTAQIRDDETLHEALNETFGVPEGARITMVDRIDTPSPRDVLDEVLPRIEAGRAVRLTVRGGGEVDAIYITPVED